jgi:sigma-B regulation protein RsbU (phosphoserine phosphatase)
MAMQILIVDDDATTLHLIAQTVRNLGYEVATASDGIKAWDILREESISFVITDWRMPGMDGLCLCRQIRSAALSHYVYVIFMTTSEEKNALIKGMKAGADDFIVKPLDEGELHARLKAGERILKLQEDLEKRNENLSESNRKLSKAYSVIKKDLEAGATIQSSLLPQSASIIYGIRFDSIFLPSAYVAGDIFNYFKLDETHLGFYVLDVAGHGIPAAMLSVTLSKALSPTNHQECLLKQFMPVPEPPYYEIINPANAIRALNERFQANEDTMQYFTMIYGLIDIRDGRTVMTQAGHPPPIFLQKGKKAILIGTGGYPVGMLPDVDYEEEEVYMHHGDRLIFYSDGITECTNNDKEQFSAKRFVRLLEEGHDLSLRKLMERIEHHLRRWKEDNQFEDDVTLLAMEMV